MKTEESTPGGAPPSEPDPEEEKPMDPEASIAAARLKKKQQQTETEHEEIIRCPLPRRGKGEIFALAEQLLGASKIKIVCEDQKGRLGRIPGKIRKRMWIREGDLLIVRPWEFQTDKADIIYRYTGTQSKYLSRMGKLPEAVNVF